MTNFTQLYPATLRLWRDSPRWRGIVIGASVLTIFSLMGNHQSSQTLPPPPALAPTPVPIVSIPTVTPIDQQAVARLDSFYRKADAAESATPEEGAFCEQLVILRTNELKPTDAQSAQSAQRDMLNKADSCDAKLAVSDRNFEELSNLDDAVTRDQNARTMESLAQTFSHITPFDLSRPNARDFADIIDKAKNAKQELANSDQRIKRLVDATSTGKPNTDIGSLINITEAFLAINAIDEERMTETQKQALSIGQNADATIRESNNHLTELSIALENVERISEDDNQLKLIEAYGRLTELDIKRASAAQHDSMEKAAVLTKEAGIKFLATLSPQFSQSPTLQLYEQLAAIRHSVGKVSAHDLPIEAQEGLKQADLAVQVLADSDRRIAGLVTAVAAWEHNPGPAAGGPLTTGFHSIQPLDQQRLTPEQSRIFDKALAANQVIQARTQSLNADSKGQIPIFVTTKSPASDSIYLASFQAALRAAGFVVINERNNAAIIMELSGKVTGRASIKYGNADMENAKTELVVSAFWAYDKSEFFQESRLGSGTATLPELAMEKSYQSAADQLIEVLNNHIINQRKL